MTATTLDAKQLYEQYAELAGTDAKKFTSFKSKDAIAEAIKTLTPKAPKPAKETKATNGDATPPAPLSGETKKVERTMTKAQRAMARRFYDSHKLPRPDGWVGAALPVELCKELGI